MKFSGLIALFLIQIISLCQTTRTDTLYSAGVKDKYVITVRKPAIDRIFETLK